MNYLRHLNGFFERLAGDKRLSSYHISLYLALFWQWNACRFQDQFVISRAEMMEQARIGSANTYARCMKELTDWGYIHYKSSSNLHRGSEVRCIRFDQTTDSPADADFDTSINAGTAENTGKDTTGDTSSATKLKTDTTGKTADDTSTSSKTARNASVNTAGKTGIIGDIKKDTSANTTDASSRITSSKLDTAKDTSNPQDHFTGIQADTGIDTASDTLLIKNTNKNKQEENQKRVENHRSENRLEKVNMENWRPGKNLETEEESGIPDFSEVSFFFEQNRFPKSEAQQFYSRYLSLGWKTGNAQRIVSWQALARKWMLNSQTQKNHERPFNQIGAGRFSSTTDKDYSEPL
ncbi:hypothetical protein [uncultured Sunxiuqinia sp.]|uniref:hypothetical protein n=1 Tax=uncultured Sunxiuqinia sp. TaxID=1573825 RepID=UPI00262B1B99|nr:hypothetical protein [uncultured Sunxiuqinia sp.]